MKVNMAQTVYEDALRKLKWNLERGKEDKANEWALLAAALETSYKIKRPAFEKLKDG